LEPKDDGSVKITLNEYFNGAFTVNASSDSDPSKTARITFRPFTYATDISFKYAINKREGHVDLENNGTILAKKDDDINLLLNAKPSEHARLKYSITSTNTDVVEGTTGLPPIFVPT
jgi:hypothetical protein